MAEPVASSSSSENQNKEGKKAESVEEEDEDNYISLFLPAIYAAVHLDQPKKLPKRLDVDALWPIVVQAMEMAHGWRDFQEIWTAAERAASLEKALDEHLGAPILQRPGSSLAELQLQDRKLGLWNQHVKDLVDSLV